MTTLEQIDRSRVPQHVAIIMDGNGRWAMKQNRARLFGHNNAIEAVRAAVESAVQLNIGYLTLYTFSTENWNRPQEEVNGLMELLIKAVHNETKILGIDDKTSPTADGTVRDYITNGLYESKMNAMFQQAYLSLITDLKNTASIRYLSN